MPLPLRLFLLDYVRFHLSNYISCYVRIGQLSTNIQRLI
ncbi:hypothetical protein COI_1730 [Mannheimia haemolytica serotype A2 str. OVINE]|nr:hypothetical protein COI_1730 [Mannheimia haemolytica serotype A2 str. OVINE]